MLHYPKFNPVAFHIGSFPVHWYGIMYLIGFVAAWGLAFVRARQVHDSWSSEQISDLIFYAALGVILGGRIGYMVFYDPAALVANPLNLFKVWQGGMAFHGGLLGVIIAMIFYARRYQKSYAAITDFLAPLVPLGLAAGRIGNFINGELWGRVTHVPWAMVFPQAGPLPRHPSQLYEFLFEGLVLLAILWIYARKPRPPWAVSGVFLLCYGGFRFTLEFFRQPDPQLGFIVWHWLTMGQLLSLPMIIIGVAMIRIAYRRQRTKNEEGKTLT